MSVNVGEMRIIKEKKADCVNHKSRECGQTIIQLKEDQFNSVQQKHYTLPLAPSQPDSIDKLILGMMNRIFALLFLS